MTAFVERTKDDRVTVAEGTPERIDQYREQFGGSGCMIAGWVRFDNSLGNNHRLLLALMSHSALGACHSYSTYGATGLDLIPDVLSVAGLLSAVDTDIGVVQASRIPERSAVHAS